MSLTKKDLQLIEELFDRKFDEKFDQKFDEKFDEKLGPNLEKIQRLIDESNAEQTAMIIKHFTSKDEHQKLVSRVERIETEIGME